MGNISDLEITTPEAFAKILGLGSLQEAYARETKSRLYLASKEARDDVRQLYNAQKQINAKQGINVDDPRWSQEMLRAFWMTGDFSLGAKDEWMKLMMRDAKNQGDGVMAMIHRNIGTIDEETLREVAFGSGNQDELEDTLNYINELSKQQIGD